MKQMMKSDRIRAVLGLTFVALLTGGAVLLPSSPVGAEAMLRHLELDHALPGPDSVMTSSITEVRLHFSEPPQMRATSIRIVDGSRSLISSSPPIAFEEDPRQVFVTLESALPEGAYTVQWRVMAQDGHVQRDQYSFRVTSE
jgi:methionine-rich copper-binding protein CopC